MPNTDGGGGGIATDATGAAGAVETVSGVASSPNPRRQQMATRGCRTDTWPEVQPGPRITILCRLEVPIPS